MIPSLGGVRIRSSTKLSLFQPFATRRPSLSLSFPRSSLVICHCAPLTLFTNGVQRPPGQSTVGIIMVTTKIALALCLTFLASSGMLDFTRGESSEMFKVFFVTGCIVTRSNACYEVFPRQRCPKSDAHSISASALVTMERFRAYSVPRRI